jgi:hypothetical protein
MSNLGKCPECQHTVSRVIVEAIQVDAGSKRKFKGVSYLCPSCLTVLGAGIDPVALKSDTISGVAKKLRP